MIETESFERAGWVALLMRAATAAHGRDAAHVVIGATATRRSSGGTAAVSSRSHASSGRP